MKFLVPTVLDFSTASARDDGMGWGGGNDWDVGFNKGQCASTEVVTGIAEKTDGTLGSIRCSELPSGVTLSTTGCTRKVFSQGNDEDATPEGDWAQGFFKGECGVGLAVQGVSAFVSASGSIPVGAAHAIRCCPITPAPL